MSRVEIGESTWPRKVIQTLAFRIILGSWWRCSNRATAARYFRHSTTQSSNVFDFFLFFLLFLDRFQITKIRHVFRVRLIVLPAKIVPTTVLAANIIWLCTNIDAIPPVQCSPMKPKTTSKLNWILNIVLFCPHSRRDSAPFAFPVPQGI